jgi:hypothetical protein
VKKHLALPCLVLVAAWAYPLGNFQAFQGAFIGEKREQCAPEINTDLRR